MFLVSPYRQPVTPLLTAEQTMWHSSKHLTRAAHNGTMTSEFGNVLPLFVWSRILTWAGDRYVPVTTNPFGLDKKIESFKGRWGIEKV